MEFIKKNSLYLVFIVSLLATLTSLYFSEIRDFPPCVLCWYQRVFMYPIVFISAVGILLKDVRTYLYIFPLTILGGLVAIYHNLLYYGLLPNSNVPCANGVSCTTEYISYFGFITIPLLSLTAFVIVLILLLINRKNANV